jgi:serine protease DegQ
VLAEAARLLDQPPTREAYVGIDVQPLTAGISRATGSTSGLVVTWVDPRGPAAGAINAGDVIEAVNGAALWTTDDWDVQVAHLGVDQPLTVGVRDAGGTRDVPIVSVQAVTANPGALGLTLRELRGTGTEVVRVDRGSVGQRGGLRAGDVITRVGSIDAPAPAEVRRAFGAAEKVPLIVAFTRGTSRRVTALER